MPLASRLTGNLGNTQGCRRPVVHRSSPPHRCREFQQELPSAANRPANSQQARVEISAVTEVSKKYVFFGERGFAQPMVLRHPIWVKVGTAIHPRHPCSGNRYPRQHESLQVKRVEPLCGQPEQKWVCAQLKPGCYRLLCLRFNDLQASCNRRRGKSDRCASNNASDGGNR